MKRTQQFSDDWITSGWSREPNTRKWIELGKSASVTVGGDEKVPPEIAAHDVADELNELESQIQVLMKASADLLGQVATLAGKILTVKADTARECAKLCDEAAPSFYRGIHLAAVLRDKIAGHYSLGRVRSDVGVILESIVGPTQ